MFKLWLIVGPSGTGKTTLVKTLVSEGWALEAVSYTTRKPRAGELEGIDYYFVSKTLFNKMVKNKEFVEHVVYNTNFYGISRDEIDSKLSKNHVLLVTEGDGAEQLKEIYKDKAVVIFLVPPSLDELKTRLKNRNESDKLIEQRLALVEHELGYRSMADIEIWPDSKENMITQMCMAFCGVTYPKVFEVNTLWDQLKVSTVRYFSFYAFIRKWVGGHWEEWTVGPLSNKSVWLPVTKCYKQTKFQPGFFLNKLKACECYDDKL